MNREPMVIPSNLDFTQVAKSNLIKAVKSPYFLDNDCDMIFDLLNKELRVVPFGDYLKRYIHEKAELNGDYQEIALSEYQDIILNEFLERRTPCSFSPTTIRLKNASKNWLEQQTVNRNVVLLLGFGLGMSEDDVNIFFTKALHEHELNAKDPLEAICQYCYRNHYGYLVFESLWKLYKEMDEKQEIPEMTLDSTVNLKNRLSGIRNEKDLLLFLSALPVFHGAKQQSVTARKEFDRLYTQVQTIVARLMTEDSRNTAEIRADRLAREMDHNDRLFDYEKRQLIVKEKSNYRQYSEKDITPADIESILHAAVPKDSNGNLSSMKNSALYKQFDGKRLSRQHLSEILSGKSPITRYDLITLNFFIISQEQSETRKKRYQLFIDTTNRMLRECGFGSLYVVNPYECFLLMCVLSEDPLGTYADVWELSYTQTD